MSVLLVGGLTLLTATVAAAAAVAAGSPAARLVGEWDPGFSAAEAGGRFLIDGYGVGGLGAYQFALDDGTTVAAVCVQADIGHSMDADYQPDDAPTVSSAELDYLLWRHLGPGGQADDVEAAAINVLAWRYAQATRSGGGLVWAGDPVEVAVDGVGRRTDIEQAVIALGAEAAARRGPWTMGDLAVVDGVAAVNVQGPGGPIAGVTVRFELGAESWTADTDDGGRAEVAMTPPGTDATLVVTATAPGPARTFAAPGSQRVAIAGAPIELRAELPIVAPTTTTTTTLPPTPTTMPPTTVPPTTVPPTTVPPTTVPPTTLAPTTTAARTPTTTTLLATTSTLAPTTTAAPTTTLVRPPASPTVPPPSTVRLADTGGGSRSVARVGAWLVAVGGLAALAAARRRAAPTNR